MSFEHQQSGPILAVAAALATLIPAGTAVAQYAPNPQPYQGQPPNQQQYQPQYQGQAPNQPQYQPQYQGQAASPPQYQGQAQFQSDDQARRDYDARYGPGAYDQARAAHDRAVQEYDAQNGPGAYDRAHGAQAVASPPPATAYDQNAQAAAQQLQQNCNKQKQTNQVIGGLLGTAGGALLGNSLAHGGGKTGGTIIGGVAGAAAGVGVGTLTKNCNLPPAQ